MDFFINCKLPRGRVSTLVKARDEYLKCILLRFTPHVVPHYTDLVLFVCSQPNLNQKVSSLDLHNCMAKGLTVNYCMNSVTDLHGDSKKGLFHSKGLWRTPSERNMVPKTNCYLPKSKPVETYWKRNSFLESPEAAVCNLDGNVYIMGKRRQDPFFTDWHITRCEVQQYESTEKYLDFVWNDRVWQNLVLGGVCLPLLQWTINMAEFHTTWGIQEYLSSLERIWTSSSQTIRLCSGIACGLSQHPFPFLVLWAFFWPWRVWIGYTTWKLQNEEDGCCWCIENGLAQSSFSQISLDHC